MLSTLKQGLFPGFQAAGTYLGSLVIRPMAYDLVQALLPSQLEPAPQEITQPGAHPVIFTFGEHIHTRLEPTLKLFEVNDYLEPFIKRFDTGYLQFILIVPLVRWTKSRQGGPDSFSFMPRLYTNKLFPVIGSFFYGFAAKEASMGIDNATYLINNLEDNEPIISGNFKMKGHTGHARSEFPLFEQHIPDLLQATYVGQTQFGTFACATFDWGLAEAEVQAVKAEVHIAQPFVTGITPEHFSRPSIEVDPLGSFRLCTRWTLSPPRPLRRT